MTHAASIVPAESDILCEGCGYVVSGLPIEGRCPECGKPISESLGSQRIVPEWERPEHRPVTAFFATSWRALFTPTQFYRSLATRRDVSRAVWFARIYWAASAV